MKRALMTLLVMSLVVLTGFLIANRDSREMTRVTTETAPTDVADRPLRPTGATPDGPTQVRNRLPGDPYAELAGELHARGVEVWFEIDLVERWLEGPEAFEEGLDRLRTLATLSGVRGFKVADELGYDDGITSAEQATEFLRAVRTGLRSVDRSPEILVDMVVPDLGCLGWSDRTAGVAESRACARDAVAEHPAAVSGAVTGYLRERLVDRLDLSTSLLDEWTYESWGLGQVEAQSLAWSHVNDLGWGGWTVLQSRKALAQPGGYADSGLQALHDVRTFIDTPVAAGAEAVDIWAWRQGYDGRTVSLLNDDLDSNPLWRLLEARRRAGVRLITHITPSMSLPAGEPRNREHDVFASVFDVAFVAAGSG